MWLKSYWNLFELFCYDFGELDGYEQGCVEMECCCSTSWIFYFRYFISVIYKYLWWVIVNSIAIVLINLTCGFDSHTHRETLYKL